MNWNKRTLVICDLDGSLLKDDETISQFSVDIIKKFTSKNNNKFCIATGRPIRAAIKYYKQLGLDTIMANLNGANIINPTDPNFSMINLGFSKEAIKHILSDKKLLKYIGCVLIENIEGTYVLTEEKSKFIQYEFLSKFHINTKKQGDEDGFVALDLNEIDKIDKDVNSILIYIKDKKYIDEITFKIKSITNTLIVRSWSIPTDLTGTVIEVNSIFSSKGTVTKFLSSYYMIPLNQTYSFGDGENDVDMLTRSNGYAMKNASHTVKLLTHRITKYSNDQDGIAKEMQKLFKL
ncbi:HAD family hydrolase [Malacoplasma penetrans]|uniref:Uncharacterized protein n=1 Tax=Malacoplasma penetrans (strain HF-2) TaxID=272633 RepID=Q8EVV2_MALP2|nr:HAD family hydrolase [Malacoplasma penetrans]RXY97248.1 HAD family hydrolase [Malacoplasma penetrans]BAC44247.1 conserved hypothetical protein [Malacoplasma penetrans HF-2]